MTKYKLDKIGPFDNIFGGSWNDLFDFNHLYKTQFQTATLPSWQAINGKYVLTKDIPGISKEQLNVEIDYAVPNLNISAKSETRDYSFTISIPNDMDSNSVSATLKDGVLTVSADIFPQPEHKKTIQVR